MGVFSFVKPGKQIFKTITSVKPGKNLTTKRKIQDETVKSVDEGIKKADAPQSFKESQKIKQYASEMKRKKSKELKDYSYRLDKLTEKKATGGRVGRKFGNPKPKTAVEKIKKAFDPKKSDLNKDGRLTSYEKKRGMAIAKAMRGRNKNV